VARRPLPRPSSFISFFSPRGLQYRHFDFEKLICDTVATLYVNIVDFGPVIPEFKIGAFSLK